MQWVIFYNLKCPIGLLGQVYKSSKPSHRLKSSWAMTPVWSSKCRRAYFMLVSVQMLVESITTQRKRYAFWYWPRGYIMIRIYRCGNLYIQVKKIRVSDRITGVLGSELNYLMNPTLAFKWSFRRKRAYLFKTTKQVHTHSLKSLNWVS
jgi:hypothetical protein